MITETKSSIKLPEPKYLVETAHTEDEHYYKVGTELYPGVTSFLDIIGGSKTQALMGWAKKQSLLVFQNALTELLKGKEDGKVDMSLDWIEATRKSAWARPKKIKDAAADLGTRVHEYIDAHIKGQELPVLDEDMKIPVGNFFSWLKETGIEIVSGDVKIANREEQYGGAADAIGWKKDKGFGIIDWKTSNQINQEYALQAGGAYAEGMERTYGITMTWAEIVRFDKLKPIVEHATVRSLSECYEGFLTSKRLTEIMKNDLFSEIKTI